MATQSNARPALERPTADTAPGPLPPRRRKVLALLPRELDAESWADDFHKGVVPDKSPYGYHHAQALGYEVVYTPAARRGGCVATLLNRAVWRTLGFDLAHLWRSRRFIADAKPDLVWSHTEHEYLAFLLLRRLGMVPATPLLAQTVWLADQWSEIGWCRRTLCRWLIRDAEMCAFLSPLNEAFAREQQWGRCTRMVEFGISLDSFAVQAPQSSRSPGALRVLAVGNDRHRDWTVLHHALARQPGVEVKVASSRYPLQLVCANIEARPYSQAELHAAYQWADVVVVPLVEHLHASGITVVCEAVAMGKPVVASRTGGLDHYFTDEHIDYVPVGDAQALKYKVRSVALGGPARRARIVAAQARMVELDLSSAGYARRLVELSDGLLASLPATPQRSVA